MKKRFRTNDFSDLLDADKNKSIRVLNSNSSVLEHLRNCTQIKVPITFYWQKKTLFYSRTKISDNTTVLIDKISGI